VGDAQDQTVIGRHHLAVQPVAFLDPGADGEGPGCGQTPAERTVQDHPPVPQFVQETLDHEVIGRGQDTGRLHLGAHMAHSAAGGIAIQAFALQNLLGLGLGPGGEVGGQGTECAAEPDGAAVALAVPEGDPPGKSEGGGDGDPLRGDFLDPPGGGAERDDITPAGLVDHLLVQFADPLGLGVVLPGREEHRVQAAVGDGAATGGDQTQRAGSCLERAGLTVQDQAGPQLRERGGRVASREQVHHPVERLARER
jgi:hypothetical protein